MPPKKNQHFVPVSYLKAWADDDNRTFVYVPDNEAEYPRIPISNVASEDYFYSNDAELEDSLGKIEQEHVRVLAKLRASHSSYPDFTFGELRHLYAFLMFQRTRTKAFNEDMVSAGKRVAEEVSESSDVEIEEIEEATDEFGNLMKRMMIHSLLNTGLISDLRILLLVDCTGENFVTSDVPVIFDRPAAGEESRISGLINAGLQIFCPISPTHCLLLYDPSLYRVNRVVNRPIAVEDTSVVQSINRYMVQHRPEKVYYQSGGREEEMYGYLSEVDGGSGLSANQERSSGDSELFSLNQLSPPVSPVLPFLESIGTTSGRESRFGEIEELVVERTRERVDTVVRHHDGDYDESLKDVIEDLANKEPSKDSPIEWEPN